MGLSFIDPFIFVILFERLEYLSNYLQQTKDIPTGTLGNHRQYTQNERGFFFNEAE